MAGPDNERFETMLRRELKSAAAPARADCPGPEMLAAFWERSLSRSERALVDSHLAGCARCQSAMAAMARAQSALGAEPSRAYAPGFWLRVAAPASVLAVVLIIISMHTLKLPEGEREQIAMAIRHRLHRHHPESAAPVLTPAPPPSETRRMELAKSQPAPQITAAAPSAENQPKEKRPEQIALASTAPSPAPQHEEPAMRQQTKPHVAAEKAEGKESSAEPSLASSQSAGAPAVAAIPQAPSNEQTAAPQTGIASNYESEQDYPRPGSAPGAGAGAITGNAGGAQIQPQAKAPAATPSVQARAEGLRPGLTSFQSPPPVVAWNVGAGGVIQRLGQTGWETEESGTSADLLSGSAPSAQVCWVAGRDGTLLRTTDGGAHWHRVPPPAPGDLVKVEASGPDSATVTTSGGHRFSTTDGGRNWTGL